MPPTSPFNQADWSDRQDSCVCARVFIVAVLMVSLLASGFTGSAVAASGDVVLQAESPTSAPSAPGGNTTQNGSAEPAQTATAERGELDGNATFSNGSSEGDSGGGPLGGVLPDVNVKADFLNAFLSGAMEIVQWLISQGLGALNTIANSVARAATLTPSADNPDEWYIAPSGPLMNTAWSMYAGGGMDGLAIARIAWVIAFGLLFSLGGLFGINYLNSAVEKKGWMYLVMGLPFATEAGWSLLMLYLDVIDIMGQGLIYEYTQTTPFTESMFKGVVVILVLLALYFETGLILMFALTVAFRIEALVYLTPLIPACYTARAIPVKYISAAADALMTLWYILSLSSLPSAILVAGAFKASQAAFLENLGMGTIMALLLPVAGIAAAMVVPYAMWKAAETALGGIGIAGMGDPDKKVRDKKEQYRERHQQMKERGKKTVDVGRQARQKAPSRTAVADGGRRAVDASRNAAGKAREGVRQTRDRAANAADYTQWKAQYETKQKRRQAKQAAQEMREKLKR